MEKLYRDSEIRLDAAIKEAVNLISDSSTNIAAILTDAANIKLVAMENEAFKLIREGNRESAFHLLRSQKYEEQKSIYREGMVQFGRIIQKHTKDRSIKASYLIWGSFIFVVVIVLTIPLFCFALLQLQSRIIEHKQAEKKNAEKQKNFEAVFAASPVGLLLIDESIIVSKINNVTAKLIGKNVQEIVGTRPGHGLNCIHSFDEPEGCGHSTLCSECPIRNAVESVFETGQSIYGAEVQVTLLIEQNPIDIWLEVCIEPLEIAEKKHVLVAVNNITERKQANEYLMQAKIDAEIASESKSGFLANMSHEIRTPMNAVIGFSDILADEELTNEQNNYVNMIRNSGKHLLQIINDILDFSKIEAGKLDIEKAECSLKQLFTTVESIMHPLAAEKGLKFGIKEDRCLPDNIFTDSGRLQQCMINLINNAIKFTEEGHVYVNVSLEDKDNKPFIRFDVEDTGIGIPSEKQEKVFKSFDQADGSTSRKYGGTGLGLEVTIAEDGNEAVEKALAQEFDLILMDIQMPNMNGYEATKSLRKQGITTPIVTLTAHVMTGDDQKCIRAGCDDYLPKPLDHRQLLEKLRKYLKVKVKV